MSEWLQTLGRKSQAPVTAGSMEEYFSEEYSEEVDLVKPVNAEIDRLQKDKEAQAQLLIQQYKHMYKQDTPGQKLLKVMKQGVETKDELVKYMDFMKPMEEFHRGAMDNAYKGEVKWVDGEVQKEIDIEVAENQNKQAIEKAKANATGDEVHALEKGVTDVNGISQNEKKRYYFTNKRAAIEDSDFFLAEMAAGLQVPVPTPDGGVKWTTLEQAGSIKEARYIANSIVYYYLYTNEHLTMGRPGRFKREFVKPMLKKIDGLVAKQANILSVARIEDARNRRAEELNSTILTNPGYAIDYVNIYKEVFNGDVRLAKLEMARHLADAARTGKLSEEVINNVLDHEFHTNLSRPDKPHIRTMRDYWKNETRIIQNGLAAYRKSESEEIQERADAQLNLDVDQGLEEMRNSKEPWSNDKKQEWIKKLMSENSISYEQLPDRAKNAFTASTVPDYDINYNLEQRVLKGETLKPSDLDGIKDYDMKKKWLKELGGGIDTSRRDKIVQGYVDAKTQNTLGDAGRGLEWRAYEDNAVLAYNSAFAAAKATGANQAEAHTAAIEAVTTGLDIKNPNNTSWSTFGAVEGQTRDSGDRRNLGLAKSALAKNPSLLDSDKPWIGEEPHIAEAVKYMQGSNDQKNLPVYYRNFPSLRKLPDGTVATPINLMKYRLNSLGLLKDNKPLPEDKLPPYLHELLRKPSPSKTLRVVNDEENDGINLIDPKQFDSRGRDQAQAIEELRAKAQVSQQYALIDSSYRTLVNIPEELSNEFIAQVGELPPYMRLENLQPEVAKALVADTLMT